VPAGRAPPSTVSTRNAGYSPTVSTEAVDGVTVGETVIAGTTVVETMTGAAQAPAFKSVRRSIPMPDSSTIAPNRSSDVGAARETLEEHCAESRYILPVKRGIHIDSAVGA